jgi:hypothetical protein
MNWPNTELTGPIPTGRGLERVARWVIGTRTEAERQELRAGGGLVVQANLIRPEFLPGAGDWKAPRYGLRVQRLVSPMFVISLG